MCSTYYEYIRGIECKRRHYARVPSLTGRDVLLMNSFVKVPKNGSTSLGLWLVEKLHNLITKPEIRASVKTKEILGVKGFRTCEIPHKNYTHRGKSHKA